jgi:glycyl-tRNA synthetase beta chain
VILGNFEPEYLSLPEEVLVTVMRDHQKYFAVEDANGKLAPHFLAVLNTSSDADGLIRHGNERVLRARFNDARFFWQTDQKIRLRERVELLKSVTFQKDLGSYFDKAIRTQHLASLVAESVREQGITVRPGIIHKAALLAKADLTTELVKEFTELQGIIGGLYARAQAEALDMNPFVGDVIYDHYKPESMEDAVPRTLESAVLSISDKADSIAGMFALGMQPTGSKDPFALRRAANGIVRILAEHKLPLSIAQITSDALLQYMPQITADALLHGKDRKFTGAASYREEVAAFFRERLEFYLRDVKGYAYDVVNAVLASGADHVPDAILRAEAVAKVRGSDAFTAISSAFKRSKNVLRQAAEKGFLVPDTLENLTISDDEDVRLKTAMFEVLHPFREYTNQGRYDDALNEMAKLRNAIDYYFDHVMVMVDDEKTRSVRLALLNTMSRQFSRIADFSEIVTERKSSQ